MQVTALEWGYLRLDATGGSLLLEAVAAADGSLLDTLALTRSPQRASQLRPKRAEKMESIHAPKVVNVDSINAP